MKFQRKDNEYQLAVKNAVTWFDELVRINGCQCSTSTFIHNTLIEILEIITGTYSDGNMVWDKEVFERVYPVVTEQIKNEEREKVYKVLRFDLIDYIERRLKDG